jgi:aminopeptidase-like protein
LPVGCLMRSVWGEFPEYHTSADNLDFVTGDSLADTLRLCLSIVDVLENDTRYRNTSPFCEPALGRRGLYETNDRGAHARNLARLWVLNFSDGDHSLLDIAERAGLEFALIRDVATELVAADLLRAVIDDGAPHD